MTNEELENENILYLTIGKEVKIQFDNEDNLEKIELSNNKIGELFSNGLIDQTSIFDITVIGLITKSNFKTYIRVRDNRPAIHSKNDYEYVSVDQKQTREHKGNNNPMEAGKFIFYVEKGGKYPKNGLVSLYNPKKRYRK